MTKKKKQILIVDDHPLVRSGLAQLISSEADLEICGQAAEAGEAMRLVESTPPDLVVVDLSLKSGSGLELIKQIKAYNDRIQILVSSMHDELIYAERCLNAGAMGYVMKQEDTDAVIKAIHRILDGNVYLSPRMTERMMLRMTKPEKDPGVIPIAKLTNRELQVLELIGQGLTTSKIASFLHLSVKSIETYRESIKRKLNLGSGAELARFAVQWSIEEQRNQ